VALSAELGVFDLVEPPLVLGQVLFELTVDCIHFTLAGVLGEQGFFEELGKHVQGMRVALVFNLEVIVGVVLSCSGILVSTMFSDVLGIRALFGIFLCPEEEHVLTEVSKTLSFRWIIQVA